MKKISLLVAILITILSILLIGLTWYTHINEVTAYPATCSGKDEFEKCNTYTGMNPTTYIINRERQEVLSYMPGIKGIGPERHTKCAVINIKNWSCKSDDNSWIFGVSNGTYFDNSDSDVFIHLSKDEWLKSRQ